MAYPTGTVSFAKAGVLRVYLSARFYLSVTDFGSPDLAIGNLRARAYIGPSGTYTYTQPVDKFTKAVFVDVAYPGGSVSWNVGVVEVDYTHGDNLVTLGLKDIRVSWELVKK